MGGQSSGQGEQENTGNEQDQNPQTGGSWNNYRTKEIGSKEQDSGNRNSSEESVGGGTLY